MSNQAYSTAVQDSGDPGYTNRLLIGTPVTGLVRIEWVQARYGQLIPCNWGMVQMLQAMNSYMPLRYQVADAQNLIVKEAVEKDFEWLFLLEHDVLLPPDGFIRLNEYMREKRYPVVSGLYYTRSKPSEPLIYRGRGTSFYTDWKPGDKVMVDGVPTGALLIHGSLLKAMWNESEEYQLYGMKVRRVFDTPRNLWMDPQSGTFHTTMGTSDLDWCTKVMAGNYFTKAGWPQYQEMRWPFLIDTALFCKHINNDGSQYP